MQPRAYWCAVGCDDIGFLAPSIITLSVMWLSFGPVCATWSTRNGAARQNSTTHDEQTAARQREEVAPQPQPHQIPGAAPVDLCGRHPGRKWRLAGGLHFADRGWDRHYLRTNAE